MPTVYRQANLKSTSVLRRESFAGDMRLRTSLACVDIARAFALAPFIIGILTRYFILSSAVITNCLLVGLPLFSSSVSPNSLYRIFTSPRNQADEMAF